MDSLVEEGLRLKEKLAEEICTPLEGLSKEEVVKRHKRLARLAREYVEVTDAITQESISLMEEEIGVQEGISKFMAEIFQHEQLGGDGEGGA